MKNKAYSLLKAAWIVLTLTIILFITILLVMTYMYEPYLTTGVYILDMVIRVIIYYVISVFYTLILYKLKFITFDKED